MGLRGTSPSRALWARRLYATIASNRDRLHPAARCASVPLHEPLPPTPGPPMKTPQITLSLPLRAATLLIPPPARAQRVHRPPLTLTQKLARFDGSWSAHGVGLRLDVQAHTA